jgi:hypothetical protein
MLELFFSKKWISGVAISGKGILLRKIM